MKNFDLEPFDEETKILLQYVNDNFSVDTVEKVEFMNFFGMHEVSVYNVKKLYIAKKIIFSDNADIQIGLIPAIRFYDITNVLQFELTNTYSYWDSLLNQLHRVTNYMTVSNILFSYLVQGVGVYNRFQMLGYRITLQ